MKPLPANCAFCACARVGDRHTHTLLPGKVKACFNCDHPISVSRATLKTMRRHPQQTVFVCLECTVGYTDVLGKFTPLLPSLDQVQELQAYNNTSNN